MLAWPEDQKCDSHSLNQGQGESGLRTAQRAPFGHGDGAEGTLVA